jgi:predicted MFS family arabinose efflux permease
MIEQTMTAKPPRERAAAEPNLTPFFATAVGVIVLPLYAAQPLLGLIGTSLAMPVSAYGVIAMMSMVGYAAGLFLLVPLTDLVELRRITLISVAGEMLGLIAAAGAPDGLLLGIAALAVGAMASSIQMLVPVAAALADPAQRGGVIGKVMSGLMIGILLSRPVASLAAEMLGWRGAFEVDAAAVAAIWVGLYRALPYRRPSRSLPYQDLLASLFGLVWSEAVLRRRATYQALCMGAFGLFWSGVGLRLSQPPFGLGQTGLALFALAGAGGAVIAPLAGLLGDRGWTSIATRASHGAVVAASHPSGTPANRMPS